MVAAYDKRVRRGCRDAVMAVMPSWGQGSVSVPKCLRSPFAWIWIVLVVGRGIRTKWSGLEHSFTYTIHTTSPFTGVAKKGWVHLPQHLMYIIASRSSLDAASALYCSHWELIVTYRLQVLIETTNFPPVDCRCQNFTVEILYHMIVCFIAVKIDNWLLLLPIKSTNNIHTVMMLECTYAFYLQYWLIDHVISNPYSSISIVVRR